MNGKRILLFDFDGTIADSFKNFIEIVDILADKYHFPKISQPDIELLRAKNAKAIIGILGIPFYKIPFVARDMKKMQRQKIDQIKPFHGMSETIQKLSEMGYQIGILTSNSRENVNVFLKSNNIDVFDFINTDAGIFGKEKLLRLFLRKNKVGKEEVIYIGDEIRDIYACRSTGIKIVSVAWGFNSREGLVLHKPDYIADTPEELIRLVKNL